MMIHDDGDGDENDGFTKLRYHKRGIFTHFLLLLV